MIYASLGFKCQLPAPFDLLLFYNADSHDVLSNDLGLLLQNITFTLNLISTSRTQILRDTGITLDPVILV